MLSPWLQYVLPWARGASTGHSSTVQRSSKPKVIMQPGDCRARLQAFSPLHEAACPLQLGDPLADGLQLRVAEPSNK